MATAETIAASLLSAVAGGAVYPLIRPALVISPAVVTTVISITPDDRLSASTGANLYRARIQADCFERTYAGLKVLVDATRAAVHLRSGNYAGKVLASSVVDIVTPDDFDPSAGIYSQSVDFILTYYD